MHGWFMHAYNFIHFYLAIVSGLVEYKEFSWHISSLRGGTLPLEFKYYSEVTSSIMGPSMLNSDKKGAHPP